MTTFVIHADNVELRNQYIKDEEDASAATKARQRQAALHRGVDISVIQSEGIAAVFDRAFS
ncbi:hypothetical protein L2735_14060 [Shewanella olleyana]|uniref:hypothetical protein n=1 Tax=Shewanella olleyana TaxID=135626 RepID=UPI00200FB6D6|nr:hypothetical protein [Shewanella olleyana]MCL1067915.1 hypothetical protein [Shewanella olleyana]